MVKKSEEKGLVFILGTAFVSGVSIFINKWGVRGLDPYLFTGLKNLLVGIFLFSLIVFGGQFKILRRLSLKRWLALFLIGFLGGSVPFLLFFKGLSLTSAAQASLIHKNMFLLVALLATVFLKERLERSFLLAALFLVLGNLFLIEKTGPFSWDRGCFLVLLATVFWSGESVFSKQVLKALPARIVAWGRMFFGSLLIIFYLGLTGRLELAGSLNLADFSWILLTSLFLLAYVSTWYEGLKRARVSLAASILTLGAPITSFLGLFSGRSLGLKEIGGMVFLSTGIVLLIGVRLIWRRLSFLRFFYARD